MDAYKETVQDIEEHYAEKRDAVEDKYDAKRSNPSGFKIGFTGGIVGGGLGSAAGAAAGTLVGAPFLGLLAGGGMGIGIASGYDRIGNPDGGKIYRDILSGTERVEKGWYDTRERAAKSRAKAASWADINGLLGND